MPVSILPSCASGEGERGLWHRPAKFLVELGRRRMVGGKEDMIVDVVLDLMSEKTN